MIPQSASSIANFKLCPMLYRFKHVLKLAPIETPEAFRQGTNWHKCLEILKDPEGGRDAMIAHLNQAYATCPPSIDLVDWEIERTIILYSALGWEWHWQVDPVESLAREVSFKRQVNSHYSRRGIIDQIIRHKGLLGLGEYKSTSKPIDPGSLYWDRLKLDSQPTLYLIEARHAQLAGDLEQYGISATDPLISGVLYDVWHKPQIRPRKLSQGESKKFTATGEYFGEKFDTEELETAELDQASNTVDTAAFQQFLINGKPAEITPGKKEGTFAIRETPEMFGARLLADIRENPEKHFARKPISRTDAELERLDQEYYNIARTAHFVALRGLWYVNENQCDATYRCSYHPICYYNQDVSNGNVPDGFKCLNKEKKDANTTEKSSPTDASEGTE